MLGVVLTTMGVAAVLTLRPRRLAGVHLCMAVLLAVLCLTGLAQDHELLALGVVFTPVIPTAPVLERLINRARGRGQWARSARLTSAVVWLYGSARARVALLDDKRLALLEAGRRDEAIALLRAAESWPVGGHSARVNRLVLERRWPEIATGYSAAAVAAMPHSDQGFVAFRWLEALARQGSTNAMLEGLAELPDSSLGDYRVEQAGLVMPIAVFLGRSAQVDTLLATLPGPDAFKDGCRAMAEQAVGDSEAAAARLTRLTQTAGREGDEARALLKSPLPAADLHGLTPLAQQGLDRFEDLARHGVKRPPLSNPT